MIELEKRGVLKITVGSVLICSFILALMYPLISARYNGKIHFLMSPNPHAVYSVPPSKEADVVIVWVAVVKDSTYGSFTMAMVGYNRYVDNDHWEYYWHYYTNNLRGAEKFASLNKGVLGYVFQYEVSVAKIDVTMTEHQLNATVRVKGEILFIAKFWADTSVPIESRLEPMDVPSELWLSVEAYRPILEASVTGIEVGDFIGGHFDYVDTELCDSSLLP